MSQPMIRICNLFFLLGVSCLCYFLLHWFFYWSLSLFFKCHNVFFSPLFASYSRSMRECFIVYCGSPHPIVHFFGSYAFLYISDCVSKLISCHTCIICIICMSCIGNCVYDIIHVSSYCSTMLRISRFFLWKLCMLINWLFCKQLIIFHSWFLLHNTYVIHWNLCAWHHWYAVLYFHLFLAFIGFPIRNCTYSCIGDCDIIFIHLLLFYHLYVM